MSSLPATNDLERVHYWERTAQRHPLPTCLSHAEHRAVRLASEIAASRTTALDFGCGGGRFAELAAGLGWKPICMDVDPEAIALCDRRLPESRCVVLQKNASVIPLRDASVGMIMCIEVKPVMTGWFAAEASRILMPGGLLVGVAYNQWSYRGALQHLYALSRGTDDWYEVPYPRWRNAMRKRGFEVLSEEGCYWPPFRRESNSRLLPLAIRIERILRLNRAAALSPLVVFIMRKRGAS